MEKEQTPMDQTSGRDEIDLPGEAPAGNDGELPEDDLAGVSGGNDSQVDGRLIPKIGGDIKSPNSN